MKARRIVTGHSNGKSVFVSDGLSSKGIIYKSVKNSGSTLLWRTEAVPTIPTPTPDAISANSCYVPGPGETTLMYVTWPPDSAMNGPDFNPAAMGQEFFEHMPELACTMEPDNPGMHTTDTVDYVIVLEGEVWLELDDGKQVHLKPHDVVVQNGTRHVWRNKSDKPVKVAVVMVGAKRR